MNRTDVAAELQALGADAVLQDELDLAECAQAAAGGAPIRLGIDAMEARPVGASATASPTAGSWSSTER